MVSPPSPHTKPDRAYHHGDLRNALIDAGLTALEAQDASELSLRALARELGVSANAVYRHFADKEALLSALAAEGLRRFAREQREARAQLDTEPAARPVRRSPTRVPSTRPPCCAPSPAGAWCTA